LADVTSFWSVERGRPGAEGGKNGGQGSREEQGERPPKQCKLSSRRPKREREIETDRQTETDDDFVVNRSASKVEAGVAPNQTLVIEVVKGPSKGKVYRAGPNQKQLSVGRTKASLVHVKSPGVSEKHAEVSNCERRHSSRPHEVLALSAR